MTALRSPTLPVLTLENLRALESLLRVVTRGWDDAGSSEVGCLCVEWGMHGAMPLPFLALKGKGLWGLTIPLESGPAVAKTEEDHAGKSSG